MEVVFIEHLNVVGVKRKRLNGDAFLYKRVCEDILKLASLWCIGLLYGEFKFGWILKD